MSLCILVGCSIVLLALVKVLPETMQRIVNGSSMANGSALVGAAAAVGGAVGIAGLGHGRRRFNGWATLYAWPEHRLMRPTRRPQKRAEVTHRSGPGSAAPRQ